MIVKSLIIPPDVEEMRLMAWLKRMLPETPEYQLREAFERRDVKLNDVRVRRDVLAEPGAEVKVYLSEEKKRPAPPLLYEDDNILIVWKPAGCSCEPDNKGGQTIIDRIWQGYPGRFSQRPLLCHRLDNPTDGLLVLARHPAAQEELQQAFRLRQVHKQYTCLVRDTPIPSEAVLEAWLRKNAERARVDILDAPAAGAVSIRTGYRVLEAGPVCRLEVSLYTGRTHQIRAQMAHIGHPLLGDDKYGDRAFNKEHNAKRLMLTATGLYFSLEGPLSYLNDHKWAVKPEF